MKNLILGALVTAASVFGTITQAHEDPPGDVHPRVVAINGRFEVYFTNNREPREPNRPVYRTTYSADGTLLANRELFAGRIPESEESNPVMMLGERPDFQIIPRGADQPQTITPKLPPGAYTDCFVLGWLPEEKFVMRDSPARSAQAAAGPFSLRLVSLFSGNVLASAVIGMPVRIYDFATTSGVLSSAPELIIAWMEARQFPDEHVLTGNGTRVAVQSSAYRVIVTRWQPATGQIRHAIVAPAVDGNVAISIGRVDKVVLVAWHELGKIRIRRVHLETTPFEAHLPELRRRSSVISRRNDQGVNEGR